jgi:ATP-dependent DNA helicase RecQ
MTRARQTLALARLPGPHPIQDALSDVPSVLIRQETVDVQPAAAELFRRYRRFSLRDVYLSFAGRRRPDQPVHRAIAALSPGDPLQVRAGENRWELLDRSGTVVGQLARGFHAPAGTRFASATVLAIVNWDRERSEPEFRSGLICEAWEVVVPELVFEPDL